MEDSYARILWAAVEPVHIVTYFTPECRQANKEVGLKGFWMGYFGSRAAPLGPVPPEVVISTFYGFHPGLVRRAVPDAWGFAAPDAILEARTRAAATVLRRLVPGIDAIAAKALPMVAAVMDAAEGAGRPLFNANRGLPAREDAVEALWQACTALREHRGDGHLAVLIGEGLDGLESNLLSYTVNGSPIDGLTTARGYSPEDLADGVAALAARGLLDVDGAPTERGRTLRASIEDRTDTLAAPPYRVLEDPRELVDTLGPAANAIMDSGEVPFPNPVGLTRL